MTFASKHHTRITRSKRAGLIFPVGRIERFLRQQTRNKRIGSGAPVFMTAVLEYICAEILELAGNASKDFHRKRITPRHIYLAVRNDQELQTMYSHVVIPNAGVIPNINSFLVSKSETPDKNQSKKAKCDGISQVPIRKLGVKKSTKSSSSIGTLSRTLSRQDELALITVLHQKKIGDHTLKVVQSNICHITTDAIVHPTNSSLSLSGGVGGSIQSAAGPDLGIEINRWNAENSGLATSCVCMTGGHKLRAHNIIHVCSPTWGPETARKELADSVTNIFKLAEKHKLKSIAFPSIGSGANRFPKHTAAAIILRAIQQYFENVAESSLNEVYFVLYDKASVSVYKHELINL